MSFPTPRPLRFGVLADRSLSLFVRQFPAIWATSRVYLTTFCICLALLLLIMPLLSSLVPTALIVWVWLCVCMPLWQWAIRRTRPNFWGLLGMMVLNLLGVPFFRVYALVFAVQAEHGLCWSLAWQRSRAILREHGSIVVGLLAVWLTLPLLLARSLEYLVQSCLPWLWGVFDVSVDIQVWAQPVLLASQCLLAAWVMIGFELSLGLLCQDYARCREGGELWAALDQEYGS